MKILVTGSAGHLGEALLRTLHQHGHEATGLDLLPSPFTTRVGSITDPTLVARAVAGMDAIVHAATLHKPHVATHSRQQFVDVNITGTLTLLEHAVAAGVGRFVFTSTTSVFGRALTPAAGAPAVWVTEALVPQPKNIYGVTKLAAENLCELFHRKFGLPTVILRTSRFFPEADDDPETRAAYTDANAKANELLYRRADIEDIVSAHQLALEHAPRLGLGRYIVSATTPFGPGDCPELAIDAPAVVRRHVPAYAPLYARLGWRMLPTLDRVYDNTRAREELGWQPRHDFARVVERLAQGGELSSPLARAVGSKGYHGEVFAEGPYPVE